MSVIESGTEPHGWHTDWVTRRDDGTELERLCKGRRLVPTLPPPTERLTDSAEWWVFSRVGGLVLGFLIVLPLACWLFVWLREPLTMVMRWYMGLFP